MQLNYIPINIKNNHNLHQIFGPNLYIVQKNLYAFQILKEHFFNLLIFYFYLKLNYGFI